MYPFRQPAHEYQKSDQPDKYSHVADILRNLVLKHLLELVDRPGKRQNQYQKSDQPIAKVDGILVFHLF